MSVCLLDILYVQFVKNYLHLKFIQGPNLISDAYVFWWNNFSLLCYDIKTEYFNLKLLWKSKPHLCELCQT